MALRPDQVTRIVDALNAKKGAHTATCALCGHSVFSVGNGISSIVSTDVPGQLSGPYMPLVSVICINCGNTHFVNLRILGLVDIAEGRDEFIPPPAAIAATPGGGTSG